MKFCVSCNNMYYIKIDENKQDQLIYYCRNCGDRNFDIENGGVCVINTQLKRGVNHFEHIVNKYTKLDPTLPRIYNIPCPNKDCCTNSTKRSKDDSREILYIRYDDSKLKYLYMCCKCDNIWT